eukprot:2793940-Ditylum_brightwellii.AAC.1
MVVDNFEITWDNSWDIGGKKIANKPGIVVIDKITKTGQLIYVAVPYDTNIVSMTAEKITKYLWYGSQEFSELCGTGVTTHSFGYNSKTAVLGTAHILWNRTTPVDGCGDGNCDVGHTISPYASHKDSDNDEYCDVSCDVGLISTPHFSHQETVKDIGDDDLNNAIKDNMLDAFMGASCETRLVCVNDDGDCNMSVPSSSNESSISSTNKATSRSVR